MGSTKMVVAGLASILMVAIVIAVMVCVTGKHNGQISSSTKSLHSICAPTDYKEVCEESLSTTNSSDPKELMKVAFQAAVRDIQAAVKNSTLYKGTAADARTRSALEVCEEVLNHSIDDVERSSRNVDKLEFGKMDLHVEDLKIWLSSAITHHETCIDAFQNTTGDSSEKMKKFLETSYKMLSNGLAMVDHMGGILSSLGISSQRRLLTAHDGVPHFVDSYTRKLMEAEPEEVKGQIVVSKDGSGDFGTITDAIKSLPKKNNKTIIIRVKKGVYKEYVTIPKKMNNIKLIGDGPKKTRILGNKNFADGVPTFHTPTVVVGAEGFMAKNIGIENSAGPEKHQAVAIRVSGDYAVFDNVHMDGYQDTLYAHSYRQYYHKCVVTGTIDFVFGDAMAVFQKCKFVVRKPMENQACMVTAQGRKDVRSDGMTVIQNSVITCEPEFVKATPPFNAYLGRPWKEYSRTIIMGTNIDGCIVPQGWSPWMGTFALDTLYYGEYQNTGPGSNLTERVTWKGIKQMTPELAKTFSLGKVFVDIQWIKDSGIPYVLE